MVMAQKLSGKRIPLTLTEIWAPGLLRCAASNYNVANSSVAAAHAGSSHESGNKFEGLLVFHREG